MIMVYIDRIWTMVDTKRCMAGAFLEHTCGLSPHDVLKHQASSDQLLQQYLLDAHAHNLGTFLRNKHQRL